MVREGARHTAACVPGLRQRPDRAASRNRSPSVHGIVATKAGERERSTDSPAALLLGHRGLRCAADFRGARRNADSSRVRAARRNDYQRRQFRWARRRAAAVQSRQRLRRSGLSRRALRPLGRASAPRRRASADPGAHAEPHQVHGFRPRQRPGVVPEADRHAARRLPGTRRGTADTGLRRAADRRAPHRLRTATPRAHRRHRSRMRSACT